MKAAAPAVRHRDIGELRPQRSTLPVWVTLNGGASLIRRGGEAYAEGTRVEDAEPGEESRTRNDVQLAFGFEFPVGR